jgi:hypothetical protein
MKKLILRPIDLQTLQASPNYAAVLKRIPNTDLDVSQIGLGSMMFGSQIDYETASGLLDSATKEIGLNLIVRNSE